MINANDARNILILLDRVEVKGLQEVQVAAVIHQKLSEMVRVAQEQANEDSNGEDTDPTG